MSDRTKWLLMELMGQDETDISSVLETYLKALKGDPKAYFELLELVSDMDAEIDIS